MVSRRHKCREERGKEMGKGKSGKKKWEETGEKKKRVKCVVKKKGVNCEGIVRIWKTRCIWIGGNTGIVEVRIGICSEKESMSEIRG